MIRVQLVAIALLVCASRALADDTSATMAALRDVKSECRYLMTRFATRRWRPAPRKRSPPEAGRIARSRKSWPFRAPWTY